MTECTCTMLPVRRSSVILGGMYNKYVTYLDCVDDDSVIDPKCPFHGTNGTMVLTMRRAMSERALAVIRWVDRIERRLAVIEWAAHVVRTGGPFVQHAGSTFPSPNDKGEIKINRLGFTNEGDVVDLLMRVEEVMRHVPIKQHDRSEDEQAAVERFTSCWSELRGRLVWGKALERLDPGCDIPGGERWSVAWTIQYLRPDGWWDFSSTLHVIMVVPHVPVARRSIPGTIPGGELCAWTAPRTRNASTRIADRVPERTFEIISLQKRYVRLCP